ncbi:MAG TPA: 3-oxoacyl-ACP synthase [Clostridiales bacterium]|nr:MAG: 3-oxoacyl-ACP synthase [Clostridiales bacterium GWD2_32_59]HAN09175.1 3-oxoacyl-ACP synthase [Clostridiales bacterium]
MNNIKIIGYGSCMPSNIVTNEDLSKIIDTSDEWISKRTGIKERRISKGESTSDLAIAAAKNALDVAGISASEIDLIIVATSTSDCFFPSTGCTVQSGIGATNATSFDLAGACTGFIYATDVAIQYLKAGRFKNALIIGAEVMSKVIDWNDRGTAILFGDGAGAVVMTVTDEPKITKVYTKSDGTKSEVLKLKAVPIIDMYENVKTIDRSTMTMNGQEVFKFACNVIIETIDALLANTSVKLEDVDYIVLHQANSRIIEYVSNKVNINIEKFFMNLDKYGNTSAASIPIALDEMYKKNILKSGHKVMLIGFGGGLTWGGVLLEL